MAPFQLEQILGTWGAYAVYLLVGVGFGAVLEMAGFANTRKLAAQFYFKDLTVLKVMFTAIITAMTLIFLFSAMGMLDYTQIWVNPTYLWPGIVGGLIMGFGFIVGGFCPGTSLVALSTLKVDGMFFTLGALVGIFIFGETVGLYDGFWNSSYLGRFTLPEWLGLDTGLVVILVLLMAFFMFWGGEKLEQIFGDKDNSKAPKLRYAGAGALLLAGVLTLGLGQPTSMDKWERVASVKEPLLTERQVQIHPGELAQLMDDDQINLLMLDLRKEAEYNIFHLQDARRVEPERLDKMVPELLEQPANTVIVLIDNDEQPATDAWKTLTAERVINLYLLEGGINNWLDVFGHYGHEQCPPAAQADSSQLRHLFQMAGGSADPASEPDYELVKDTVTFTSKVKLQARRAGKKGGCG